MTIHKYLQQFCVASILLLAACATTVKRGHLKEDESLGEIKPGVTTQASVQKLLGSPSSQSTFGPPTWYYVSSIHEQRSALATRIIDQHVIEVAFDTSGVVGSVKEYGMKDGKNVQIAEQTTPTEGQQLGFFEQILGNLGRFNNNTNAASNSHTHGNGGVPTGYPSSR